MTAAILSIGTELTRGELSNGNGVWLADSLTRRGYDVVESCTVADDVERLAHACERLLRGHQILVATGGLGPTSDDLTRDAVARMLDVPLEENTEAMEALRTTLNARGRAVTPSNARQVQFPRGATLLANPRGTAPGFAVTLEGSHAFFMPGVPTEMRTMFNHQVVPRLPQSTSPPSGQVILRVFGLPESEVGDSLRGIESNYGVRISYRIHLPDLEVKILASDASLTAAKSRAEIAAKEVEHRLGKRYVYARGDSSLPATVGRLLCEQDKTLAIAESCTGGLVAQLLTETAGASEYFLGGAVTYADSAKTALLDVPNTLIVRNGAVSEAVAEAMARGIRSRLGSDYGLALTGVAGPSGGTRNEPVGCVYCALAHATGKELKRFDFVGERSGIQRRAAFASLALLREHLITQKEESRP